VVRSAMKAAASPFRCARGKVHGRGAIWLSRPVQRQSFSLSTRTWIPVAAALNQRCPCPQLSFPGSPHFRGLPFFQINVVTRSLCTQSPSQSSKNAGAAVEVKIKAHKARNESDSKDSNAEKKEEEGKSHLRQLWDKYGWTGIGTYVVIDIVTLGGFYVLIRNGVDVKEFLNKLGILELMETFGVHQEVLDSKASHLFTAWALYTSVAPLRFTLTFALTPLIQRYFAFKKARAKNI